MTIEATTYTPPIPGELNQKYRTALSEVPRWQGGPLLSILPESNLEHVDESLVIAQEIQSSYPHLAIEIDFETVTHMIYLHDAGEIITGDLCLSRPDYTTIKDSHKRKEKAALRYLVSTIDNPDTKELVERLARRYHRNQQDDRESLMSRLIDKVQALRFGLINVYPTPKTNEEKVHVSRAIRLIESIRQPLRSTLSNAAQFELDEVVEIEWQRIKKQGYII